MSALSFLPHAVGQQRPQIIYATVSANQPVPSSFSDPLHVVQPHAPTVFRTITDWPACHGSILPAAGADCICVYDDQQTLRCIWWDSPLTAFTPTKNAGLGIGDLIVSAS